MSPGLSERGSFCLIPGAGAIWHQKPIAQACNLSRETRKLDIYMKSYDFWILATNATKKNNTLHAKENTCMSQIHSASWLFMTIKEKLLALFS